MQYTLCYLSSAKKPLSNTDIEHLFSVNKRNNTELNISGVLIYNYGNFLQILEGDKQKIDTLYLKIRQDSRHHNIIELLKTSIEERLFNDYDSGVIIVENSKALNKLKKYLDWVREVDLNTVDKIVNIIENFIGKK